MNKFLLILGFSFLLASCSKEELNLISSPCVGGECQAEYVINPLSQPDAFVDENGYWHVFHMGINYFTVDGFVSDVEEEYYINKVPLVESAYDSDYWVWINSFQFTVPLYSFLGYFTGGGFNNPIPVGNQEYTIQNMAGVHPPLNIAGYQVTKNMCLDCPYTETLLGTYSKYTTKPKQNIFFDNEMVGDTAKVIIRTKWATEWDIQVEKSYELKIIFDKL